MHAWPGHSTMDALLWGQCYNSGLWGCPDATHTESVLEKWRSNNTLDHSLSLRCKWQACLPDNIKQGIKNIYLSVLSSKKLGKTPENRRVLSSFKYLTMVKMHRNTKFTQFYSKASQFFSPNSAQKAPNFSQIIGPYANDFSRLRLSRKATREEEVWEWWRVMDMCMCM